MKIDRNKLMQDLMEMNERYRTKEERQKTYSIFKKKLDMYCDDLLKELDRDIAEGNKRLEEYFNSDDE